MKFVVDIECDNAAFDGPGESHETARILRELAMDLERYPDLPRGRPIQLHDINGKTVGRAKVVGKR